MNKKEQIWNGMNKHKPLTEEEMKVLAKKVVNDVCEEAAEANKKEAETKKAEEVAWRKG